MYLSQEKIDYLITKNNEMLKIRNQILEELGVDLVANDNISLITSYPLIHQYDTNYAPNFSRNGEDGISVRNGLSQTIETKSATVKKNKSGKIAEAEFMFHCNNLKTYDRYVFIKWTIERKIYKIWDFSDKNKVDAVELILKIKRNALLAKNNGKTPNRDVITILETEIIGIAATPLINNLVYTDYMNGSI
jgi:hypothetical protein